MIILICKKACIRGEKERMGKCEVITDNAYLYVERRGRDDRYELTTQSLSSHIEILHDLNILVLTYRPHMCTESICNTRSCYGWKLCPGWG